MLGIRPSPCFDLAKLLFCYEKCYVMDKRTPTIIYIDYINPNGGGR